MPSCHAQTGRARWVALVAIAALAAGIGIAWQQSRPLRPVEPPLPGGEPGAGVIDQALEGAASRR